MNRTVTHPLKTLGKPAFLALFLWLVTGCATLMNGVRQPLEVKSDTPVTVMVDGGDTHTTPAVLPLLRRNSYVLRLVAEGESDTAVVTINRKKSGWLWGNAAFLVYGVLIGLPVDFIGGGAYKLELQREQLRNVSTQVDLQWYPDPQSYGTWHMSLGYLAGAKKFSSGGIGPDAGFQLVVGKNDWPMDVMAEGFFYSSPQDVLNLKTMILLNAGVRKTFFRNYGGKLYPHLGAGLTWLSQSTQKGGGLPFGMWARTGVDLRLNRFFIGPYLGYSKLEMVASSRETTINTAGLTWGSVFGIMW